MKLVFSKKNNLTRKNILFFYFLVILTFSISLGGFIYYSIEKEPAAVKSNIKTIEVQEDDLSEFEDFQYLGVPIDTDKNIGKNDIFN